SEQLIKNLRQEFDKQQFIQNGYYQINYGLLSEDEIESFIHKNKSELITENLTGIIFISSSAEQSKEIAFYSKNPKNNTLFRKIDDFINKVLIDNYFKERKLSNDDIAFATNGIDFKEYKISETADTGDGSSIAIKEEGYGNLVLSFLFTFLLYISLIVFGSAMLQAVIEEKNNRIIEVLLSSLNSTELLSGKILGTSITGVIQMAIWMLPVFVLITTTVFVLP